MAALNNSILLTSGGLVNFGTYQVGTPASGNMSYSNASQQASIHDFRNVSGILNLPICAAFDLLTVYKTESEMQQAAYQEQVFKLKNNVYWFWGNSEIGGCYVRKTSATKAVIGGLTGFHKNNADKYAYIIGETSPMTISDLSDVCFFYDEDTITLQKPTICVFTLADMRICPDYASEQINTYYAYKYYDNVITGYSPYIPLPLTAAIIGYNKWVGILGDKPEAFWVAYYGGSVSYPHSIAQPILGCANSVSEALEWGDEYGGQLADDEDDPNDDGGTTEEQGGNGDFPSETGHVDTSDSETLTVDCVNSGFVTLYNPSLANVKAFNNFLFQDITEVLSVQLKRLIANPLDYVLFLALCHFTPPTNIQDTIQFAGINTNITCNKISRQYKKIDCGTVHIGGDSKTFLDYNNLSRASIFLPYIGIKQLDIDDIIGSDVSCVYNIDLLTGSCIAEIKCERSLRRTGDAELDDVLYNFTGNCYQIWALTGTDWRSLVGSTIGLIGGAVGLAGGNVASVGAIANSVMTEKVTVQRSANPSSNYGYLGHQKPYIILERPVLANPYNYRAFKGYTLNMRYKLSNLHGYTEIEADTLWIDAFDGITESEAQMLKDITRSGFYL